MKIVVVLGALLLLVWLVLGSVRRAKGGRREGAATTAERPAPRAEDMVACAHCGVHLPASLALVARGQAYCSEVHREAGPRAP